MLDHLTRGYFAERVGRLFELALGDQAIQLELVEVKSLGSPSAAGAWGGDAGPARRESFSLVFRGPSNPPLQQGLYKLDPTEAEELAPIFLVPIAADDQGRYYEAIFN